MENKNGTSASSGGIPFFILGESTMKSSQLFSKITVSAVLAVCAVSANAQAQDLGFYVAGDIGQSKYAISSGDAGLLGTGVTFDQKDSQTGVAFGVQLNKGFALELGYADFGKAKIGGNGSIPCSPNIVCLPALFPIAGDGRAKSTHFSVVSSAAWTDALSIFGRIGASRTDLSTAAQVGNTRLSTGEKKTETIYGFGLSYTFNKNVDATLEWKKLNNTDVDAVSAGVRFRF
jgi:opacity protein-like surface antigen